MAAVIPRECHWHSVWFTASVDGVLQPCEAAFEDSSWTRTRWTNVCRCWDKARARRRYFLFVCVIVSTVLDRHHSKYEWRNICDNVSSVCAGWSLILHACLGLLAESVDNIRAGSDMFELKRLMICIRMHFLKDSQESPSHATSNYVAVFHVWVHREYHVFWFPCAWKFVQLTSFYLWLYGL